MNRLWLLVLVLGLSAAGAARAETDASNPPERSDEPAATQPDKTPADAPPPRRLIGERIREHFREKFGRGEAPELTRGPGIFRDVSEEELEAILAFAREHLPWISEALEEARTSDPERFRAICRRLRFEIGQLRALKASDPEAFQKALEEKRLQFVARQLAARVRDAETDEERQTLREKLRETVARLVDAELVTREAQIRLLAKRLENLRAELKERASQREAVIEKHLEEMLSGDRERHAPPPGGPPHDAPPPPPPPTETP